MSACVLLRSGMKSEKKKVFCTNACKKWLFHVGAIVHEQIELIRSRIKCRCEFTGVTKKSR